MPKSGLGMKEKMEEKYTNLLNMAEQIKQPGLILKRKSSSFELIPKNFAATISNDVGLISKES